MSVATKGHPAGTANQLIGKRVLAMRRLPVDGVLLCHDLGKPPYNHVFVSNLPIDERFLYSNRGGTYIFPLFVYDELNDTPVYNFNLDVIAPIENKLGAKLSMVSSTETFTGLELIQYIYAILYSSLYRKKYNDQLKYDFPSIPYPATLSYFRKMSDFGAHLFELHLPNQYYRSESRILLTELKNYRFEKNKVILNGELPVEAIEGIENIQLGGYRPADKWLKDRRGCAFTESDLEIYKRIVNAIKETQEIAEKIDDTIDL